MDVGLRFIKEENETHESSSRDSCGKGWFGSWDTL